MCAYIAPSVEAPTALWTSNQRVRLGSRIGQLSFARSLGWIIQLVNVRWNTDLSTRKPIQYRKPLFGPNTHSVAPMISRRARLRSTSQEDVNWLRTLYLVLYLLSEIDIQRFWKCSSLLWTLLLGTYIHCSSIHLSKFFSLQNYTLRWHLGHLRKAMKCCDHRKQLSDDKIELLP